MLYPGASGELLGSWALRPDDFVSFGSGFPTEGGSATPLLRLRRQHWADESELVQETALRLSALGGEGVARFEVAPDGGCFEAELGLINDDGGWLSLARSNRLQHAVGIGLDFSHLPKGGPRLAAADARLHPERDALAPPTPAMEWEPAPSRRNATTAALPIPSLVYGKPVSAGRDLVVEAELHLRGWAAPNSEIDLFGHPYRVGPGGRFHLVIKVDDPGLLRRALEIHPPPELAKPRED